MNLAGANRECCSLSRPAETFCPPGSRVTRQALARRAAQDQIVLDRLDNTFVTLMRFLVNGTKKSSCCGKLGNVEIVGEENLDDFAEISFQRNFNQVSLPYLTRQVAVAIGELSA
jgi:hypothetical protein